MRCASSSSYQPGEKLKLNVLRTKKRMSFEITVPENATWEKRFDGAHFERGLDTRAWSEACAMRRASRRCRRDARHSASNCRMTVRSACRRLPLPDEPV